MIVQSNWLDIRKISESGQCFRLAKAGDGIYRVISGSNAVIAEEKDNGVWEFHCSNLEYDAVWKKYFDLENESLYEEFIRVVDEYDGVGADYIKLAASDARGVRILRQDKWETLISFIISQRNNIPRIASLIEKMATEFGDKIEHNGIEYYSFPTAEQLIKNEDKLEEIGLGYRYDYVMVAANVVNTHGIRHINSFERAKQLYGVGNKVANCYCLYGLHQVTSFPVDTWIENILNKYFGGNTKFLEAFKGYEGLLQQSMYYSERLRAKKLVTIKI